MQISTLICALMASLTITACSNPLFAYNAPPPKYWDNPNGAAVTTCSGGLIKADKKKIIKDGITSMKATSDSIASMAKNTN